MLGFRQIRERCENIQTQSIMGSKVSSSEGFQGLFMDLIKREIDDLKEKIRAAQELLCNFEKSNQTVPKILIDSVAR